MKIMSSSFTFMIFVISLTFGLCESCAADKHGDFLQCLSLHSPNSTSSISNLIYTPTNSSYSSVLYFSIKNLRFSTPNTPKPLIIITPTHPSHVQASVICSKLHGLQIRTRSGGHDFEGLSYVSDLPFIVLDFINLRSITINTESSTAWVQSGATLGELYYRIAEKSRTLAFPVGLCPTVGVGGHFSGGGYGVLLRKYGLAADNVIDAYLVDADGKLHDRKSMGEDLFWAVRGGGGGFGIVVAWKIQLVAVPATVTVLNVSRSLDEKIAKVIHRWQYVASKLDENVFIAIFLASGTINSRQETRRRSVEALFRTGTNSSQEAAGRRSVEALFLSLFLGKADELLSIVQSNFPKLGLVKQDCQEMSWVESAMLFAGITNAEPFTKLENLLIRKLPSKEIKSYKIKSDYVKEPISEGGLEGLWEKLKSEEIERGQVVLIPYGGKMAEISESNTPFPHRSGYPFKIAYLIGWREPGRDAAKRHINWSREVYKYMTDFVSKSPRGAYVNYRDLDIGRNNKHGKVTSYKQASVWGEKYFGKDNFKRLVRVKSKFDPHNFFSHEQSVPPSLHVH